MLAIINNHEYYGSEKEVKYGKGKEILSKGFMEFEKAWFDEIKDTVM